jgi:hypothetical protein
MFFEIDFSDVPFKATSTGPSADEHIQDVGLRATTLTLVARIVALEKSAPSPSVTISLETSRDPVEGKWFPLGDFNPMSGPDDFDKRDFDGLLRYVRWNVTDLTNISFTSFMIFGVAR